MKKSVIIGMLIASVSAFAYMGSHGDRFMLFEELNLTPAQEKQIKTIRKESRAERFKLMDQMDDLRIDTRKRIMSVLDDKQKEKYITLRRDMRQFRKSGRFYHGTMPLKRPNCDR